MKNKTNNKLAVLRCWLSRLVRKRKAKKLIWEAHICLELAQNESKCDEFRALAQILANEKLESAKNLNLN